MTCDDFAPLRELTQAIRRGYPVIAKDPSETTLDRMARIIERQQAHIEKRDERIEALERELAMERAKSPYDIMPYTRPYIPPHTPVQPYDYSWPYRIGDVWVTCGQSTIPVSGNEELIGAPD